MAQKHGNIRRIKADVTSKSDLAAAAEQISKESGYVNLVIANSGITGPTLMGLSKDASITEFRDYLDSWDVEEYNKTYAVNTTAVFLTLVAFLELLDKGNKAGNVEQKSQFVSVASAGAFNRVPMAGFAYSGSKAATVHITKQFATKLVQYDIRANVIAPGCKLSLLAFFTLLSDPYGSANTDDTKCTLARWAMCLPKGRMKSSRETSSPRKELEP